MSNNVRSDKQSEQAIRRSAYVWNTTGSLISSFQSVLMLMVLTRVCDLEASGIFTLAFANASLFQNIGRFGIRNYQASDVEPRFGFRAYALSRVVTTSAMVAAAAVHLWWSATTIGYSQEKIAVVALMVIIKAVDTFIDMFNGSYQQDGRLDLAGKQVTAHVVAMIAAFAVTVICTHSLVSATVAGLLGSSLTFLVTTLWYRKRYDIPVMHREAREQTPWPLLRECLPLFASTFLLFYVGNAPKYAIDAILDDVAQARYGFIAMPVFVVGLLAQFVYMPLIEPVSQMWARGDKKGFLRTFGQQILVIAGITLVCVTGAALLGVPVLGWLYNTDLGGYRLDLCLLVTGGGFLALATLFTAGITVVRRQRLLTPGYVVVALLAWFISRPMVASLQIRGASLAYLGCMVVLSIWTGGLFFYCMRLKRQS